MFSKYIHFSNCLSLVQASFCLPWTSCQSLLHAAARIVLKKWIRSRGSPVWPLQCYPLRIASSIFLWSREPYLIPLAELSNSILNLPVLLTVFQPSLPSIYPRSISDPFLLGGLCLKCCIQPSPGWLLLIFQLQLQCHYLCLQCIRHNCHNWSCLLPCLLLLQVHCILTHYSAHFVISTM